MEYRIISEYKVVSASYVNEVLKDTATAGQWYLHGSPFECDGEIMQAVVRLWKP